MRILKNAWSDVSHLFFPHVCAGCGTDVLASPASLCLKCVDAIPVTNFHMHSGNQVEKIFWGRIPVTHASSLCYFNSGSLIQSLLHQVKYKGNQALGHYLGRLIGETLIQSNRFTQIDALVPLPLFPSREKKRGYNQATILCNGISEVTDLPVWGDVIRRVTKTDTQTRKNRIERWENMEGRFSVVKKKRIVNKHLILVDDVITTGATLEACGQVLLAEEGVKLSIVTLAYTIK